MEHLIKFFASCKIITISLLAWLFILSWLPFFYIYRIIIDIILKIRYSKSYGGLFDLSDCLFLMPDISKCSMTVIFYIKSDSEINLFETMRKIFQEKVFNNPCEYPKLTSRKHDFGGYPYWLKNDVTVDDTIKSLELPQDKVLTEEYLKELAGKINIRDYPKNETVLWEVHISEESLHSNNVTTSYRYPIIFRFHHCICDGTSLSALFLRLFGDDTSRNYGQELFKTLFKEKSCEKDKKSIREFIKINLVKFSITLRMWLDVIFLAPGRVIQEHFLKQSDQNGLHKPVCSGEKLIAWAVEEDVECIPLIKKIRHKTNSKFMSVVCTAISASMTNFFKRNSYPIPDHTSGLFAQLLSFPSIDSSRPIKLENKTALCVVELPTNKKSNILDTLKEIDEIMKQEAHYPNSLIARFIMAVISGIIPIKISSIMAGCYRQTFIISNVPGCSQFNIFDGCAVSELIGVAPNSRAIGITFTLVSYDNRLHIAIMMDKILTKSQEEVQRLADDIIHYIKTMDMEVKNIYVE